MNYIERRQQEIELLNRNRTVSVNELMKEFAPVSRATIMRDLDSLEDRYGVIRVRGKNGCIKVSQDFQLFRKTLSPRQRRALKQAIEEAKTRGESEEHIATLQSILAEFGHDASLENPGR